MDGRMASMYLVIMSVRWQEPAGFRRMRALNQTDVLNLQWNPYPRMWNNFNPPVDKPGTKRSPKICMRISAHAEFTR